MNTIIDVGHLVIIENSSTGKNEFLFLYISGEESTDLYLKVINGIRNLNLPEKIRQNTRIQVNAVTDFTRIINEYPETEGKTIHKLPVTAFYDTKKDAFKENLFLSGVINVVEKNGSFFPNNRLGAVVTDSDFFNREETINEIWNYIEKGQNVLLCGPRRYGKTSIMRSLENNASDHGYRPIMIDLESVFTPQEFVSKIFVEVKWPNLAEIDKNRKNIEIEEKLSDQWIKQGEKFFSKISRKTEKFLFLLDECPYMLDSFLGKDYMERDKTNQFLRWFKKQRDMSKSNCMFLLTGSVVLNPYLEDKGLNIDNFSDYNEVRLTFFDPEKVRTYIESLLLGQEIFLTNEVIQELVRMTTPGIPYFIQVVLNYVVNLYRQNPQFSIDDLNKTYQEKIIGPDGRRYFDTFERHFKRYGKRKPSVSKILRELSRSGNEGLEKQELERIYVASPDITDKSKFDIILNYLEYDFYIQKIGNTNRYRFANSILRDYWQKNQN